MVKSSLSLRCSARGEEAREVPDGQVRRTSDGAHQEAAACRDVDVREAARALRRGKALGVNVDFPLEG